MLFNAQSLCNKLSELHHLLYTGDIDIILITESWLHSDISNGLLDPDTLLFAMTAVYLTGVESVFSFVNH